MNQAALRSGALLSRRSERARSASRLRAAAIACALAGLAPARAFAQAEPPVSVWHRSADGCPDAQAFLDELRARNVQARLAQVGDTIDFVVTLGAGPGGRSRGVLERQTQTGTVAIRSVDDASCAQVSQALALTLALSIAPSASSQAQDGAAPTTAEPAAGVGDGAASPTSTPVHAANAGSPAPASAPPAAAPAQERTRAAHDGAARAPAARHAPDAAGPAPSMHTAPWSLGVRGGAATGIAPDLLASGAAFAGFEPAFSGLFAPALRLSALFAYASSTVSGREFRLRIVGARLDGCPLAVSAGPLAARPCLGAELGSIASDGQGARGRSDSGLWAALSGEARLTWRVSGPWALEADAGLALPLTRYELVADGATVLHRTSDLAFSAGFGALVQIP